LPSELNLSTISYGSGSSARSGSSGLSRSTSPPLGQQQQQHLQQQQKQGYSPTQLYVTTTPLRPTFYSGQQGPITRFPVSRTHSTNDSDRMAIAPGLTFEYGHGHGRGHHESYIDEELPAYNPQPNPYPRRRRTVPGSTLNLEAGAIPVAPGIDGTQIAAGLNGYGQIYYPQMAHTIQRGGAGGMVSGGGMPYLQNNVYHNR
jgi:hypothetical protein